MGGRLLRYFISNWSLGYHGERQITVGREVCGGGRQGKERERRRGNKEGQSGKIRQREKDGKGELQNISNGAETIPFPA